MRSNFRGERKDRKYDKKIFSRTWEGRTWKLIVSVTAFKGGQPKLLITREKMSRKYSNRPYAKLGRLTSEEVKGILPIIQEALHHMR